MKTNFITAVSEGDIVTIRLFLTNEMLLDPRGKSFEKMRTYAESNTSNLYEVHDGTTFDDNASNWDEKLMFGIRNELDYNFSSERLDYFYEVCKEVLKEKVKTLNEEKQSVNQTTGFYHGVVNDTVLEVPPQSRKKIPGRRIQNLKQQLQEKIVFPLKKCLNKN